MSVLKTTNSVNEPASIVVRAPAKINLSLEITNRRADGYHDLVTIFQTIDLCDELTFQPADSLILECDEPTKLGGHDNLVLRAARALQAAAGMQIGARIRLTKVIPIAAGLGGGSADAAATLIGLSRMWKLSFDSHVLAKIARQLGADVPFLLRGGTAVASGIGDEIEWLPDPSRRYVVLCTPEKGPAYKTIMAFRELAANDFSTGAVTRGIAEAFRHGPAGVDPWARVESGRNTFERAADFLYPSVQHARNAMRAAGAPWIRLSGAGPSIFTIFDSYEEAQSLATRLMNAWTMRVVSTCPSYTDQL